MTIEAFLDELYEFVLSDVNLETYRNMTEEKRQKLVMKQTIRACKEFAPRKNYGISRDEIRDYVGRVIAAELAKEDELNERSMRI